ncbi:MAG: phosphopantothenoylcysteine decarboxylase [Elusimicrobia bacterium]|nr:phosphopantothenoylcysteine decarboxylase [Elusimicrobiota bacterium]
MELRGVRILVTSGPTRESWDSVRYLTSRSSGALGIEITRRAVSLGAKVTLVTSVDTDPQGFRLIKIESALDMFEAVKGEYESTDVFISAAAVADFRPVKSSVKISKKEGIPVIKLEQNTEILRRAGENKEGRFLLGFSLTDTPDIEIARTKMREKNCDMMVSNTVENLGSGRRSFTILSSDGMNSYSSVTTKKAAEIILENCLKELKKI